MTPLLVLAQTSTSTPSSVLESSTNPSEACGTNPSWACNWIYDWTGSDSWAGIADWLLAKPFAIAVILVGAWLVARVLRAIVGRIVQRIAGQAQSERLRRLAARAPVDLLGSEEEKLRAQARATTLAAVARSITTGFVWFVALVAVLDVLELNLGPLLAGAGIIGVALGFGAQTMVRDYLNGFFLVVEDQYGVGDWVDLGPDAQGVVERVTLRATRLRATDGTVWHVPNGEVTRVGNLTQDFAYAVLDVQVALGVDIDEVERVLSRMADEVADDPAWADVVTGRPDLWGVQTLTREGATVRMLLKTTPGAQWRVQRELRRRVKQAFDDAGLTSALAGQPAPVAFDAGEGRSPRPASRTDAPSPPDHAAPPAEREGLSGEDALTRDALEVAARLEEEESGPA